MNLPVASAERVAARIALSVGHNAWTALVVDDAAMTVYAERMRAAVEATGYEGVLLPFRRDVSEMRAAWRRHPDAVGIITVRDGVDEADWRAWDQGRSLLDHELAALMLLTPRTAEAMARAAPHFVSWVNGSTWRAGPAEQVRELMQRGRIGEARRVAARHDPKEIGSLARVLAPPVVSAHPSSGGGDFADNARWLQEHRAEYGGRWVALSKGQLIDYDDSLITLQERLLERHDVNALLFVKVEHS